MTESDMEARVREVESRLTAMEARQGRVQLGAASLSLLWGVMLATIMAVVFVARLEAKVEVFTKLIAEDHVALNEHIALPGHMVSLERTGELGARIRSLEDKDKRNTQ